MLGGGGYTPPGFPTTSEIDLGELADAGENIRFVSLPPPHEGKIRIDAFPSGSNGEIQFNETHSGGLSHFAASHRLVWDEDSRTLEVQNKINLLGPGAALEINGVPVSNLRGIVGGANIHVEEVLGVPPHFEISAFPSGANGEIQFNHHVPPNLPTFAASVNLRWNALATTLMVANKIDVFGIAPEIKLNGHVLATESLGHIDLPNIRHIDGDPLYLNTTVGPHDRHTYIGSPPLFMHPDLGAYAIEVTPLFGIDMKGLVRISGVWALPTSGAGLELYYSQNSERSVVHSGERTGGGTIYKGLTMSGQDVGIQAHGILELLCVSNNLRWRMQSETFPGHQSEVVLERAVFPSFGLIKIIHPNPQRPYDGLPDWSEVKVAIGGGGIGTMPDPVAVLDVRGDIRALDRLNVFQPSGDVTFGVWHSPIEGCFVEIGSNSEWLYSGLSFRTHFGQWAFYSVGVSGVFDHYGAGALLLQKISATTPVLVALHDDNRIELGSPVGSVELIVHGHKFIFGDLPTVHPGAGTKELWADPADNYRVHYAH